MRGEINLKNEGYCFACGEHNPLGLHLNFEKIEDKLVATKSVAREYQGYEGIVHGGIVTTMLDEAMSQFIQKFFGEQALTGSLEIRYRHPTPTNQDLKISAWQESQRRNIVAMKSAIETADGTVTAEASAKFAIIGEK